MTGQVVPTDDASRDLEELYGSIESRDAVQALPHQVPGHCRKCLCHGDCRRPPRHADGSATTSFAGSAFQLLRISLYTHESILEVHGVSVALPVDAYPTVAEDVQIVIDAPTASCR